LELRSKHKECEELKEQLKICEEQLGLANLELAKYKHQAEKWKEQGIAGQVHKQHCHRLQNVLENLVRDNKRMLPAPHTGKNSRQNRCNFSKKQKVWGDSN